MGNVLRISNLKDKARVESLPEDFMWFWSCYPRKEKKGDAFKAWGQTKSIRPDIEKIIAAVDKYAEKCRFRETQYILLPASWLRAWSWADGE